MLKLTTVDGKLYGVGLGLNSFSMFFDTVEFEKAGIPLPTPDLTWDEYAKLAVELTKAAGKERRPLCARATTMCSMPGCASAARASLPRKASGSASRSTMPGNGSTTGRSCARRAAPSLPTCRRSTRTRSTPIALALGKSVIGMAYSNQMVGYQLIIKNKLGITMLPREKKGGPSGHYYRPALIWSVGATTKQGEAAAKFISFFVNDPEAGKILGVERGVPMSPTVREAILPQLNPTEQETVKYVNLLKDQVGEYPPPVPMGATQFDQRVLRPICDELAFERISPADAATRLIEEGKATIKG